MNKYFMTGVNARIGLDLTLVRLKGPLLRKFVEAFSYGGDGVLIYQGYLYFPIVET